MRPIDADALYESFERADCYFKDDRFITANDDGEYDTINLCMEDDCALNQIELKLINQILDAEEALKLVRAEQDFRAHKPCPYCGKRVMRAMTARELRRNDTDNISIAIICDATNGGCGANGGFAIGKACASQKWDKRVE